MFGVFRRPVPRDRRSIACCVLRDPSRTRPITYLWRSRCKRFVSHKKKKLPIYGTRNYVYVDDFENINRFLFFPIPRETLSGLRKRKKNSINFCYNHFLVDSGFAILISVGVMFGVGENAHIHVFYAARIDQSSLQRIPTTRNAKIPFRRHHSAHNWTRSRQLKFSSFHLETPTNLYLWIRHLLPRRLHLWRTYSVLRDDTYDNDGASQHSKNNENHAW